MNLLEEELKSSGAKAEYDEHAKRILGHKIILAHILVHAVKEFKHADPKAVVQLIEGEPEISAVPVYPGQTNNPVITGSNTENKVPYEGVVTYDVRFFVWLPDKNDQIKIIVDVEAQKRYHPGYDLISRAVFYGARMLSSQLGTEFQGKNYDGIKKVYTIWLCMNAPKKSHNSIAEIFLDQRIICGRDISLGRYDLLGIIMVTLSDTLPEGDEELKLHRLLGTIFASNLTLEVKKEILKKEYRIEMSSDMERSAEIMCNLSEAIEEKALEKGMEKGREKGLEEGFERGINKLYETLSGLVHDGILTAAQAAERAGLSVQDFESKMRELD